MHLRRDLSNNQEDTNDIVLQVEKTIGVDIAPSDISVSHRLPKRAAHGKSRNNQNIIVKFVRQDIKEKFYHSRRSLKNVTAADFGYHVSNKIFINENLSAVLISILRKIMVTNLFGHNRVICI
jgi:hypothetical protein